LVNADARLGAVSEFGAGAEECVVAYGLENGKLRTLDFGGEKFGAGIEGNDGIHRAGDDLRGDGDFGKRVCRERRAERGSHGEGGADAGIAMGLGVFDEGGLDGWIGFGESRDFGQETRVLDCVGTHAVGFGRFAKVLITRELGNAAGEFDDGKAAERKAGCADALRINAGPEDWVGEKEIEKSTHVMCTLAPEDCAENGVVLESVISRMIYGGGDIAVRG